MTIRRQHPDLAEALSWRLRPTTRVDDARDIVEEHFAASIAREHEQLVRSGERWLSLGEVTRRIEWAPALDRLGVERVVESSATKPPASAAFDPRSSEVYWTDQAVRADWVMLGNHDTPPISVA